MSALFFTGTDTGVGKTLVAGAVAANSFRRGLKTGVMKPCESGCLSEQGGLIARDAVFLKRMSGCSEPVDAICPYKLSTPVAPGVAAEIENVQIEVSTIQSIYHRFLEKYEVLILEGAGGMMVPLTSTLLYCDLVKALNIPVVIVARLSLGTINHILLTIMLAKQMHIGVKGIVLNATSSESGIAEKTNPDVIRKFSRVPVIGIMPFLEETEKNNPEVLSKIAAEHIDIDYLMA